jgi:hypothetical protein
MACSRVTFTFTCYSFSSKFARFAFFLLNGISVPFFRKLSSGVQSERPSRRSLNKLTWPRQMTCLLNFVACRCCVEYRSAWLHFETEQLPVQCMSKWSESGRLRGLGQRSFRVVTRAVQATWLLWHVWKIHALRTYSLAYIHSFVFVYWLCF